MLHKELSKYEKERFQRAACPICGAKVHFTEPFVMVKVKNSKATVYNFMHERCLAHKYRVEEVPADFMNIPVERSDATDYSEEDRVYAVWTVPAGITHSDSIDAQFVPEAVRG